VRALLFILVFAVSPASAILKVDARVNRNAIAINEQLVLKVTVSGDMSKLPAPKLPSLPRFNVHNAGRSTNFSFTNGRISSTVQYTFVLVPRLIGKSVIGPIAVSIGRERAQSQPIQVTILRPEMRPPATSQPSTKKPRPVGKKKQRPSQQQAKQSNGPDMFVTAKLDKQKPFVNEQTILTVRFHTAVRLLGNAEWTEPETKGMLTEDLPPGKHSERNYKGRRYLVSEIKMALFPLQPGKLEVGQSTIKTRVAKNRAVDPFAADFFQQFFSQGLGSEIRALKTRAIQLAARRLPEKGKPPGFGGAVGKFKIGAIVDRTKAKVGDALNLTVTIEGKGNLKSIGDLELPEMTEFRAYEMVGSLNQAKDANGVQGSKVFKTVLTPKVSGKLSIPGIPFAFFDSARGKYRIVKTKPIEVQVEAGQIAAAPAPMTFSAQPSGGQITTVTEDIRYLHETLRPSNAARWAALVASAGTLTVLPAFLFFGSIGWSFYRDRQRQDPAGARRRGAHGNAKKRIRSARSKSDSPEAAGELTEALSGYLGDRLNRSASGLTLKDAQGALKLNHPDIADGHLEQLGRVWRELERIRFAPDQQLDATPGDLAQSVDDLIKVLESDLT